MIIFFYSINFTKNILNIFFMNIYGTVIKFPYFKIYYFKIQTLFIILTIKNLKDYLN